MTTKLDDSDPYRDRYVAFLDMLGFSKLVEQADAHPGMRKRLKESINFLNGRLPNTDSETGLRFVQFSDCIVLSIDRTENGLRTIIIAIQMLYQVMLRQNILLRGGLAAGKFHHDDNLMFGPALITAYKFDEKNAPPRVSLHLDIVQDIDKFGIRKDIIEIDPWDSSQMLHVLLDLGLADFDVHLNPQRLDNAALYFAFIMGRNTTDYSLPPSVRAKWRWLQHYWEKTVKQKSLTRFLSINKPWEDYKKIQL